MKEYKIIPVQLGCRAVSSETAPARSITNSIRGFFFAAEASVGSASTDEAEELMHSMNREGWEVAGTAVTGTYPDNAVMLITFEREY